MTDKTKIACWPNGDWCSENMLEDTLLHKSDDYLIISIDAGLQEDDIDTLVMNKFNPSHSSVDPEQHY